jgi:hypothetical protein
MIEPRDYFLRATEQDWPRLLSLAVALGILFQREDGEYCSLPDGYVYIGKISKPTGEIANVEVFPGVFEDVPQSTPIADENGNHYLHANLRTYVDIRVRASMYAPAHPEIAEALAEVERFFVTNESGEVIRPKNPAVVFAGDQ